VVDFREIGSGELWELFARDFLELFGFFIESSPDRGADEGRDLIVVEEVKGILNKYRFRWLVSCKHFAVSGRAVTENDERNLLERMESFSADGFIGFYSTIASAGLNKRLESLRKSSKIKDFRIFDAKLIENCLVTAGYSHLLMRYFPESYRRIKPIHSILGSYVPLKCEVCGKDLLLDSLKNRYSSILVEVHEVRDSICYVHDVYCVCKGKCDEVLERKYAGYGFITAWEDLDDLFIPPRYLDYLLAVMNRIRQGKDVYSDEAYRKLKLILIKLGQRVFRYTSEEDLKRYISLKELLRF